MLVQVNNGRHDACIFTHYTHSRLSVWPSLSVLDCRNKMPTFSFFSHWRRIKSFFLRCFIQFRLLDTLVLRKMQRNGIKITAIRCFCVLSVCLLNFNIFFQKNIHKFSFSFSSFSSETAEREYFGATDAISCRAKI